MARGFGKFHLPAYVLGWGWLSTATALAASGGLSEWATIHHPRFGFTIAYPSQILFPIPTPSGQDGRVMQSADGRAKLLVATFENADKLSLEAYRQFLLSDVYANAKVDYAPQKPHWFVLSGERGEETFYERVTFSCGGRLINSWAMLYPTAEHRTYDRVVEAVAKTYSPGAGPDGACRGVADDPQTNDDQGADTGADRPPPDGKR